METATLDKKNVAGLLQKEILLLEGFKPVAAGQKRIPGLQAIEKAFPGQVLPIGAIHEFLAPDAEHTGACCGFIGGLLGTLMRLGGICLWVGMSRRLFPASLPAFGIAAEKIIFIEVHCEKDVLWVAEEGLKCKGIVAVIAEVRELTFMQSRRLQLAVESSKVSGFILRSSPRLSATACVARWQINPIPSMVEEGMPGVGHPRWQVELLKVRNGRPGKWIVEWAAGRFAAMEENKFTVQLKELIRRVG